MDIVELINKKRMGLILSDKEIKFIIENYMNGKIYDYQMSSLLMAIVIKGMTDNEIFSLTKYMLASGEGMDMSKFGRVVDKHSTGGIGDKTTMIVAPLVAACGVNVAKMSGRGLGYTGGTIDKLESIPGFRTKLDSDEFFKEVTDIGMAIVSQTNNLVPADKKIYALRDVTGTVESIALIASSIMSKKIASGAHNLVIDVKVGSGALIKNLEDAKKLASLMIKIGKANDIEVICLLTNMDIPLGHNVGNALEVMEACDVLKGKSDGPLRFLCIELASYMVKLGLDISYKEARSMVCEKLDNGLGYKKFLEFVKYQGGDIDGLSLSSNKYELKSPKDGYLQDINALELGKLSMHLGAGRENMDSQIDYGAGIVINKNIGDYVKRGDILMTLYTKKSLKASVMNMPIFKIGQKKPEEVKLIYKVISE